MSDCTTDDGSTEFEFRAYDRPNDGVCIRLLAKAATEYELSDDDVTDTTGDLIDSGVVDIDWLIARGSMAPPNYSDGEIVVSTTKSHTFKRGDGSLGVTVRADRYTGEITSVEVGAHLY